MTSLAAPAAVLPLGERVQSLAVAARAELFGDVVRARALLDEAVALAGVGTLERARVLAVRAWLRARLGEDGAAADAQEALVALEEAGDTRGMAECQLALGILYATSGRYEEAFEPLRRVRVLAAAEGYGDLDAAALNTLGFVLSDLGDTEQADAVLRAAIRHAGQAGAPAVGALAQANLAQNHVRHVRFCQERGVAVDAPALLAEALRLLAEVKAHTAPRGDVLGLAAALDDEAQVYNARGEPLRALEAVDGAMEIYQWASDSVGEVYALCSQAEARLLLGDPPGAAASARRALAVAERRGVRLGMARASSSLAEACEAAGLLAEALASYKRFHRLREEAVRERAVNRARVVLSQMEADRARAEVARERLRASDLEDTIEDLRATASALARASREDSLTGLYNRRALEEQLSDRFAVAGAHRRFVVGLLDVDAFKSINDERSHAVGDAVLRELAALVRGGLRPGDLAARLGGDELVVVLDGLDRADWPLVLERMRRRVAEHPWRRLGAGLVVTVSIGWCDVADVADGTAALALADRHLYAAKRAGRNRVAP